jgi:hypothetical protein
VRFEVDHTGVACQSYLAYEPVGEGGEDQGIGGSIRSLFRDGTI